jgi:GGDEF domain-containing protein
VFNETSNRPYRLSASIGLVQAPAADAATLDNLLARAGELMYAEKKISPNSRLADWSGLI